MIFVMKLVTVGILIGAATARHQVLQADPLFPVDRIQVQADPLFPGLDRKQVQPLFPGLDRKQVQTAPFSGARSETSPSGPLFPGLDRKQVQADPRKRGSDSSLREHQHTRVSLENMPIGKTKSCTEGETAFQDKGSGPGVTTAMDGKYDDDQALMMWEELDATTPFDDGPAFASLLSRNLKKYAVDRTGVNSELPFLVNYLSPHWIRGVKKEKLAVLLDCFLKVDTERKELVGELTNAADFYDLFMNAKGRDRLKEFVKKGLGWTGYESTQLVNPLEALPKFFETKEVREHSGVYQRPGEPFYDFQAREQEAREVRKEQYDKAHQYDDDEDDGLEDDDEGEEEEDDKDDGEDEEEED